MGGGKHGCNGPGSGPGTSGSSGASMTGAGGGGSSTGGGGTPSSSSSESGKTRLAGKGFNAAGLSGVSCDGFGVLKGKMDSSNTTSVLVMVEWVWGFHSLYVRVTLYLG